ncbi:MAG TPA: TetR/AcrR family transcriptional regulator [Acidimicrobiales bacterium]|nr:TetR/AcrR family transcriptional regulator [Acidimicrobiales bacterium]
MSARPRSPKGKARLSTTKVALVAAAVDVLRTEGFAAATARHLADRAGCNQGLVFYHFGSVSELLLAAMDHVSAERRARYDAAIASVHSPSELLELAVRVFSEDVASGDAALLVEMIAGSVSNPELGAGVKARVEPWSEFATDALRSAFASSPLLGLVGADELADAVVALYLGLELLSHLDHDTTKAIAVFEKVRGLSSLADLLASSSSPATNPDPMRKAPT